MVSSVRVSAWHQGARKREGANPKRHGRPSAHDLTTRLPGDWHEEFAAAVTEADFRKFPRTPILSREGRTSSASHVAWSTPRSARRSWV